MRLKPTPYDAKTIACTASDVVNGESPNQTDGRIASTAAVTTIGSSAQPTLREKRPTASYRPRRPRGRIRIVRAAAPRRMIVVMYCPM